MIFHNLICAEKKDFFFLNKSQFSIVLCIEMNWREKKELFMVPLPNDEMNEMAM